MYKEKFLFLNDRYHWLLATTLAICFFVFSLFLYSINTRTFLFNRIISIDNGIFHFVNAHPILFLAQIMLFFTDLDNWQIVLVVLTAVLIVITIIHEKRMIPFFLGGLLLGGVAAIILKNITHRLRPDAMLFIVPRNGYSFPSGHSVIATIFYGFIGYCIHHVVQKRWQKNLIIILTILVIILIGVSRVYLGVHWMSDVIGGWLLGACLLIILVSLFEYAHRSVHHIRYSMPHRIVFTMLFIVLMLTGFIIFSYYITHPLLLQSLTTTS